MGVTSEKTTSHRHILLWEKSNPLSSLHFEVKCGTSVLRERENRILFGDAPRAAQFFGTHTEWKTCHNLPPSIACKNEKCLVAISFIFSACLSRCPAGDIVSGCLSQTTNRSHRLDPVTEESLKIINLSQTKKNPVIKYLRSTLTVHKHN